MRRRTPATSTPSPGLLLARTAVLWLSSGRHVLTAIARPAVALAAEHDHHTDVGSNEFLLKLAFSAFLVVVGGVFSGLTLGLMGLDMVNLQVLSTSGSETEQKQSDKVMRLLERGRHWVLVCLLLSNVIVNESLPIFLDSVLGGGALAVILSTALIVIFGEIIPQAVCAQYGLAIGAACTPFVLCLMYLEYPVAYPIARLLDVLLGESHGTVYKKAELKTFVGLHGHIGEEMLNEDEVTIISAVLELSDKTVKAIMTPIEDVYSISADARLDQEKVDEILALGHSRIPIHLSDDKKSFIGMLIVKKLISYDPSQAQIVSTFPLSVLPETSPESTCLDALNYFQQGRSHMLLVSETPGVDGGAIGVVSLEDVIEEMIGEEIIDESDVFVDVHNKIKVVRGPSKPQVASGKALAPLIQGVIERRRGTRKRPTSDYGMTGESATDSPPAPGTKAAAFRKVRIRGGGTAARRSDLVRKASADELSVAGIATPRFEEPDPSEDGASVNNDAGTGFLEDGERKPLLSRSLSDNR